MNKRNKTIFERLLTGESIPFNDPDYAQIGAAVNQTKKDLVKLNNAVEENEIRDALGKVTGTTIAESTIVFTPFFTNYGKNIKLGKHVFINHACSFLDLGGIIIEDNVMIAPRVNLSSESHPVSVKNRKMLTVGPIHIKGGAWIGANATLLPGVTIGENSVVAAGAVVGEDVPDNTVVGGIPAKIIKSIN